MESENNHEVNKEKTLPAWLCIVLFIIGMLTLNGILKLFMDIFLGPFLVVKWLHNHFVFDIVNEFWMLLSVVIMAALLLHYGEDKKMSSLGLSFKGRVGDFFMGLLIAILIMGLGFFFLVKMKALHVGGVHFHESNFLFSLLFFALVAFVEEISMRGYILGRMLRTNINKFAALAISAAIFAVLHVTNAGISSLAIFNVFLAGVLMGSTYIYTKNLWFPISLHFFWNVIEGPVLGFQVSGNQSYLSILQLKHSANVTLTGGNFGFEGSIICTLLLIVFSGLIIWVMENKSRNDKMQVQENAATDESTNI
jgi:membrane protease YdiL (CAAX protease family)